LQVVLPTGATFDLVGPARSPNTFPAPYAFFGLVSDTPFESLRLVAGGDNTNPPLDNFVTGQSAVVAPEPSALVLMSLGTAALAAWRLRRRQARTWPGIFKTTRDLTCQYSIRS
jgi:hypothetical protein